MELRVDVIRQVRKQIKFPSDLYKLLCDTYGHDEQENFLVVPLDAEHYPIRIIMVTRGLVNRTMVHPREMFREAIKLNSAAILIAHNHPSGGIEPSREDDEVTKMLVEAGRIIGIEVLEHLVFTKDRYYSYAEHKFSRIGGVNENTEV